MTGTIQDEAVADIAVEVDFNAAQNNTSVAHGLPRASCRHGGNIAEKSRKRSRCRRRRGAKLVHLRLPASCSAPWATVSGVGLPLEDVAHLHCGPFAPARCSISRPFMRMPT